MYALVGLAGVGLHTLASHDSEALAECVVLQASPSIVAGIERLILARSKEVGGLDTIDCPLVNGDEVIFKVGMGHPGRGGDGDGGGRRTGCGDGEVSYGGGRCVYNCGVHARGGGGFDLVWEGDMIM